MSITIQPGISGINGSTIIGGTRFPWHNRLGQFVTTVNGGFTVNASPPYPHVPASSIQVKINGKVAEVLQDPYQANRGSWQYKNHNDQIAVGLGPSTFTFSLEFYRNGQTVTLTNPTAATRTINVLKVMPKTKSAPWNDLVNTGSPLTYDHGLLPMLRSLVGGNTFARGINDGFEVIGLPAADPPFYGVTVGIVQTITEATLFGAVKYTGYFNPTLKAKLVYHPVYSEFPPPWWDGVEESIMFPAAPPPYYSVNAREVYSGTDAEEVGGFWVWSDDLYMTDAPAIALGDRNLDGQPYEWGTSSGGHRSLGATMDTAALHWYFEDMLVGHHVSLPGVYVPIYGYQDWDVKFAGGLLSWVGWLLGWTGGYVHTAGLHPSTQPMVDHFRKGLYMWGMSFVADN